MHYTNPGIESCLERSASVFKDLTLKEKETIAQHHSLVILKKGDSLFKEDEKIKGLVYLVSGKLKIFKVGVGGREQILKMVRENECIGYQSLFGSSMWSFSSAAVEDSVVCVLEKQAIIRILKKNQELSLRLNRILCEELCTSYDRTVSLTQKHVRGRLVESLLMLSRIYGYEEDGKTIGVALSREDIAHLSNMTTSNAIRTLSVMASEGKIKIKGRKITLVDSDSLEHINELG